MRSLLHHREKGSTMQLLAGSSFSAQTITALKIKQTVLLHKFCFDILRLCLADLNWWFNWDLSQLFFLNSIFQEEVICQSFSTCWSVTLWVHRSFIYCSIYISSNTIHILDKWYGQMVCISVSDFKRCPMSLLYTCTHTYGTHTMILFCFLTLAFRQHWFHWSVVATP